jgi:soluble lytic murein transglycosylase-like protein
MTLRSVMVLSFIILFGAVWAYENREQSVVEIPEGTLRLQEAPPCVQLYDYLRTYSEKYGVPFNIAYGIANAESGYRGPFHWKYNPKLISSAAAYGAMQVQVPTANGIWKTSGINKQRLLTDLEFNVETSMKLMSHLKSRYGRWDVALGCYNTGRPVVNGYAKKISQFEM